MFFLTVVLSITFLLSLLAVPSKIYVPAMISGLGVLICCLIQCQITLW